MELEIKKMDLSINYYDDQSRISNSSIGYFIIGAPCYFSKKTGDGYKLDTPAMRNGSMIHKYILERDSFWEEHKIKDFVSPSSANQKSFVNEYLNGLKNKELIIDKNLAVNSYRNSYSVEKKTDDQIIELAMSLLDSLWFHIENELKEKKLEMISFADLNNLKIIEDNINKKISAKLLIYPEEENELVYSEFHINWIHEKTGLKCKSLIDRLIINHNKKHICLIDLKTTAKLSNFHESAIEYGYYRQMAFYWKAISWYFKNILDTDLSDYSTSTRIVAIGTSNETKNEIRTFDIPKEELDKYSMLIDDILDEIKWHEENGYSNSKEYYTNDGLDNIKNKWKEYDKAS